MTGIAFIAGVCLGLVVGMALSCLFAAGDEPDEVPLGQEAVVPIERERRDA